ncbi:hypothetical protein FSW04_12390 [Baekduia soli]|uniref:Histidine kinase/HSP90-like ATPase domain-containing protein n=1 Tax=Baekduia soli TaxID=496014 RepID=A0A5B8U628_9ACTN|nr:ATP-binding protein [Baekduia soli]QEC48288.1 hypothetical protein FSW04_12390 [Baekduia soli]
MITLALAYSGQLLRRLREERERSELLAVQSERQRIAWELHDSAKQRVHAAHLLLSALPVPAEGPRAAVLTQALAELRGATADMETSIAELRSPAEGRPVADLLRERAGELGLTGDLALRVVGDLPELTPMVAAHTYRIAAEALTNAVRHACCSTVDVVLSRGPDGGLVVVDDDGIGMGEAADAHPGHGLRSMHGRAETIGARLRIGPGPDGRGTRVVLALPSTPPERT